MQRRTVLTAAGVGLATVLPLATPAAAVGEGVTYRISKSASGGDPNGPSTRARISHDGRHACFQSNANNLPTGAGNAPDNDGHADVYWADFSTPSSPRIERVSVLPNGAGPTGASTFCDISDNGRYVVFSTSAAGIVAGHSGGNYIRDMVTHKTYFVFGGTRPVISDNGQYVAFNTATDVYVQQLRYDAAGTPSRARSLKLTHTPPSGDAESLRPEISGDGTHVAFASDLKLTSKDTNTTRDVYEADLRTWQSGGSSVPIELVSVNSSGVAAGGQSTRPGINGNGSVVTFQSDRPMLPMDTNGVIDAYWRNTASNTTKLVSVGPTGGVVGGQSSRPQTDDSGNYVAFTTTAANIAPPDRNHRPDAMLRNMVSGKTVIISRDYNGNAGGDGSPACPAPAGVQQPDGGVVAQAQGGHDNIATRPYLSGDARTVIFVSGMCDLVTGDSNRVNDIFVRRFSSLP